MAKREARFIWFDQQSLEADGANLRVRLVPGGAVERTATGLNIRSGGITDAMLEGNISFSKLADNVNIGRLDQNEIVVGLWNFPDGANQPTINGKKISTQEYVDIAVQGLTSKGSVKVLANSNQSLTGIPANIDDVTDLADGDLVLLIGQTSGDENGIWIIHSSAWDRPDNYSTGMHASGAFVFVEEGTQYHDQGWNCITDEPNDVIDTNDTTWNQFSGAGQITAGNALEKVGNTLNVLPLQLELGGNAEIDGDHLSIDYVPTNYTRDTTAAEASDPKHLAAHLKGIDNAIDATAKPKNYHFTLTSTDVTNKYIDLPNTPKDANNVRLVIKNAGSMVYNEDFMMDGTTTNRLTWAGLELDGLLQSGDKGVVFYEI